MKMILANALLIFLGSVSFGNNFCSFGTVAMENYKGDCVVAQDGCAAGKLFAQGYRQTSTGVCYEIPRGAICGSGGGPMINRHGFCTISNNSCVTFKLLNQGWRHSKSCHLDF